MTSSTADLHAAEAHAGPEPGPEAAAVPVPVPVLGVRDLTMRWPGRPEPVLDGVNLSVSPGQLVWLGGDNGAGKTTLLRIVAGMVTPESGTVTICGLDARAHRRACQRELGFLPAGSSGLYGRLTTSQHLDYWAALALVPRRERRARAQRALAAFDLEELAHRRLDRMSMGQRQRVRLAMAVLHEPRLLLLDEPQTSLDTTGLSLLQRELRGHLARGGSVLWCSPLAADLGVTQARAHVLVDARLRAAAW